LLSNREDILAEYNRCDFEQCFGRYFEIEASEAIPDSNRVVYLMRDRGDRPGKDGSSIPT